MQSRVLVFALAALLLLGGGLYLMLGDGASQPLTPVLQVAAEEAVGPEPELNFESAVRNPKAPDTSLSPSTKSSRRAAPVVGSGLDLEVWLVGKRAAGAQVFGTLRGKSLQSLGSTDAEGKLKLRLDSGSWALSVKAPGAAITNRVVWLQRGEDFSLRMDLPMPASIEGIVRDADGLPVRGNAMVWAWDSEEPDALSLVRKGRGKRLEPRLFQGRTNARGFFRLNGLDPSRSYRLAAIGPSSISVQGQVLKAGQKADLRLSPLVAHVLEFTAADRAELPSPSLGSLNVGPWVSLGPSIVRLGLSTYPELWLTPIGKRLERMPDRAGPFGPRVVAAIPPKAEKGRSLSAKLDLQFPGFERLEQVFELKPLSDSVAVTSVELQPASGPAAGSLRLDLQFHGDISTALREDPRTLGEVWMKERDGRQLSVQLPAMAQLPHTLSGIPAGTWALSFHSRDGQLNLANSGRARGSVTIKSGRKASASLDLTDLAAVSLDLKMDAEGVLGGDWGGSVILTYGESAGAGRFCTIPRAPYLVLGLAPGPFVFKVLRLRGNLARGESGPVQIRAGELARGTIPLIAPKR
ncbi:MAG: hypothetical protein ACI8QC_002517 [Planctomycetota bacterium]|jgi:hypothetical protein